MRQAKVLFLVAVSVFLFAAAYRLLAAQPAQAQASSIVSGFSAGSGGSSDVVGAVVMTPNGDVFTRLAMGSGGTTPLLYAGNFWGGGPVPTTPATLGQLKARYDNRRTSTPGDGVRRNPQDNR